MRLDKSVQATIKALTEAGTGQTIIATLDYSVLESSVGEHEGRQVRFLKRIRVHAVSPVWLQEMGVTR